LDAIAVVVACGTAATEASIAAAAAQTPHPLPVLVVRDAADWARIAAEWVVLLQAGEILAPHAAAAFATAATACPWAACLTADCDHLTKDGARTDPLFKPGPDPVLLASGLPTRGACALRWPSPAPDLPLHAHTARLRLAMRHPDRVAHIPQILSHSRPDYRPPAPARAASASPDDLPPVTILIPTAGRDAHVLRCLRAITRHTDYAQYGISIIVSDAGSSIIRRASRLPHTNIVAAAPGPFNFARVNNEAAASVQTPLMLLMNDDVAPIDPGWLHAMVRHMRDPRVGIVGARLLYGNGDVQHEGVIMGLANLCEHAGRLRPASDRGLHGLGLLDRQVSAVTGACLLIRTELYRALSGMDEAYAIALNDVDLCLRAREAGSRVVYAAGAVLYHYESLSLGRHYAGPRAALESVEVLRLRARFPGAIANDPFYSPLASLQPGREWQPAFPPRSHNAVIGTAPLAKSAATG
jgi:GT2 family glycosyltransferase